MNGKPFQEAIRNDKLVITAECIPPCGAGTEIFKSCVDAIGELVNAISVPESEDGVRMNSLAACSHIASAGAEPILHILTRDMNRIALQSMILGAVSMGIKNIFCTTGRHQTLTSSSSARGVFDIDQIQLLKVADDMRKKGELADGSPLDSSIDIVLGTDTNPFADPMELQVIALEKAVAAGADFIITQPIFNPEKFNAWVKCIRDRGIDKKTRIIASVMPLTSAQQAVELAKKYNHLDIGDEVVHQLDSASDSRTAGIDLAAKTLAAVAGTEGIGGINVMSGSDPTLTKEVLAASGLKRS